MTSDIGLLAKAIGDANRLRILHSLLQGPLCVCEIGDSLGLAQSTLSTHLQVLRQAGLVQDDRTGKWVSYRLSAGVGGVLGGLLGALPQQPGPNVVRRDSVRLVKRLQLRQQGCCVVGFGGLERHLKEVNAMSDTQKCDCGCCTCENCSCGCCCGR